MKNSEAKKKVEEFMEEDFNIKDGISGVETRGRGEECNITIVEMKDWGTKQTGKANGKEEETGRKKSVHKSRLDRIREDNSEGTERESKEGEARR